MLGDRRIRGLRSIDREEPLPGETTPEFPWKPDEYEILVHEGIERESRRNANARGGTTATH